MITSRGLVRRKAVLCPAANEQAKANFDNTVRTGIARTALDEWHLVELDPVFGSRAPNQRVRAWGVSARHSANWRQINRDDVLLFSGNKLVFACATCLGTLDSPNLSRRLWGQADWRLTILLEAPKEADIPMSRLSAAIHYSPNFKVQRFQVLNEDRSALCMAALKASGLTL
jgi:hypothetical protein